jgi:hypothetical protein
VRIAAVVALLAVGCGSGDGWERKDAWRRCRPAIAAGAPSPPCAAMRMCANEAPLSAEERERLVGMMRRAGCAEP